MQMQASASCTGTNAYAKGKKVATNDSTSRGSITKQKAFQSKAFSRNLPISSLI